MKVVDLPDELREWAARLLQDSWGGLESVSRGRVHETDRLPAFVAMEGTAPVGLATYRFEDRQCELVTLNSMEPGAGTALLAAVVERARTKACHRVWLITTNDNVDSLRFYQRRGFSLVALHRGAMERSRQLKPSIPEVGSHGIPIRDELELELDLI